jgi:hypothetical protein
MKTKKKKRARIFISKNLLLEFCKYNNMFICNGRMCNDKGVGKFTSKDASLVDYVIGSIRLLTLVRHFSVLPKEMKNNNLA